MAGTAANLVYEVAPLITQSRVSRALGRAREVAAATGGALRALPARLAAARAWATSTETRERLAEDARAVRDLVAGKAKERFAPLVAKLAGRDRPAAQA